MERIRRSGPVTFADYMRVALYDPELGFYSGSRGAGQRRDFVTSPELGPLFGAVLARAFDEWWDELGRPDPFMVVEAGAGRGALAASILAASPRCLPALRYVLVEVSEAQREEHRSLLPIEPPASVLGSATKGDHEDDARPMPAPGSGPLATSLEALPAEPVSGVVIANELLDNLPFQVCERSPDGWAEVRVGERNGSLVEVLVPAPPDLASECQVWAPAAEPGWRIPIQAEAVTWLRSALDIVERGRVILFDYAAQTAELASRPDHGWLRTYRGNGRGGPPLRDPGLQDITADVALDQLRRVQVPAVVRTQAEFLVAHGLDELMGAAGQAWAERAHVADLEALRARSRVSEGKALSDLGGLGGFLVMEWVR